jgi:GAF domain-containing protein
VTPVPEERVMCGVGRDITERRRSESEQAALQRISTLVARGTGPEAVFRAVADEVAALLDCDTSAIARFHVDGTATLMGGHRARRRLGERFPLDPDYVVASVRETGQPARFDADEPEAAKMPEAVRAEGIRSGLAAPIVVDGELWGAITVASLHRPFPSDTAQRLADFTDLIATAIANTQAHDQLAALADEQAALRRVATLVAQGVPPAELFSAVTKEVAHVFSGVEPALVATVIRFDPGPECVLVGASRPYELEPIGSRWAPKELYVSTQVLRTGRSVRVDEVDLESLGGPDAEVLRLRRFLYQVGSPVVVEGRLWGAMTLNSKEGLPPDTDERLESFTELVATAIANAASRAEVERLADEQAALRRVATLVAKEDSPAEVFAKVAEEAGSVLGNADCVLLRDEGDGAATVVAAWGEAISAGFPVGVRIPIGGDGVVASVLRVGRADRIDDYSSAADPLARGARERGIQSAVGCPIVVRGDIWGAIVVARFGDERCPPETETRLGQFADLVATAIANAEARTEIERLADEQAALRRVATLVARDAPSTEVFEAVATEVGKLLDTDITVVGRYDGDGAATAIGSWSASGGGVPVGTRSAIGGRNVLTIVAETGKPARVDGYDGASGEAAEIARRYGWRSSIAAPVVVEDRLWGVMLVATQRPEPFPAGAEERLATFTDLVATAVANAQAHDEVRRFGDEQATLRRIATLVAKGVQPEEVLAAVTEEVAATFRAMTAVLRFEDDPPGVVLVGASKKIDVPIGARWDIADALGAAEVYRTGRSARVNREQWSSAGGPIGEAVHRLGIVSTVASPIIVEGTRWGVITVNGREELPPVTEQRLEKFTELVTTAISNAESRVAIGRLADEQAALRRVATLVARGAPPEDIVAAAVNEVAGLLPVVSATMGRFEPDATVTTVASWSTTEAAFPTGRRWPTEGTNVAWIVLQTRRSARIDDFSDATDPIGVAAREAGYKSAVGSPIVVEGDLWGVMTANSSEGPLPPGTEARLASFTELVATAIANAESQSALEQLADEQAKLRRIATLVAGGLQPEEIFAVVIEEVGRLFGTDLTTVGRFDDDPPAFVAVALGNGMQGVDVGTRWALDDPLTAARVFQSGRSLRVNEGLRERSAALADMLARLGVASTVSGPIMLEGRLWGAVMVSSKEELPADTEERLDKFTELVATAVANAESRSELAASRRRIVAASDETRRQIERDLHDGTQQRLVSLGLAVRAAEANLPPERDDLRAQLSGVATGLVAAVEDLQEISRGIHPAILSKGGLAPALQALAHRSAIPVDLTITADVRLEEPIEVAAYFVASEALANAAKHSRASRIDVSLEQRDRSLVLSVRDDGVGGADATRGSGLVGLTDRVEALGGSISVHSREESGTQITAELPLELEAPLPAG